MNKLPDYLNFDDALPSLEQFNKIYLGQNWGREQSQADLFKECLEKIKTKHPLMTVFLL